MEKEIGKEKISHRAKVSILERCLNCLVFSSCDLSKVSAEACVKFVSLPIEKQLVVVNLVYFSSLKGLKNPLCSF
jgi:hypothetical protein